MAERQWEKVAAATGLAFVAVLIVQNFVAPQPPKFDALPAELSKYVASNGSKILLQAYLGGLSLFFGAWFIGALRAYLGKIEGDTGRLSIVAFGGGILLGAAAASGIVFGSAAVHATTGGDLAGVHLAWDLALLSYSVLWFPAAVLTGATCLVASRSRELPDWYAWYGVVLTAFFVLAGASIGVESGPFQPMGVVSLIAFIGFLVWIVVTSVLLIKRAAE